KRAVAAIAFVKPQHGVDRRANLRFQGGLSTLGRSGINTLTIDLLNAPPSIDSFNASQLKNCRSPIQIGQDLPEATLFLEDGRKVNVPLEDTYRRAWKMIAPMAQLAIEAGEMPKSF